MTGNRLLSYGWKSAKKYLLVGLTVAVMRAGIVRVLSDAAYPLTGLVFKVINFIMRRGFPDHLLLNENYGPPWKYHAMTIAQGLVIFAVGMFLGLWANVRAEREKTS